MEEIGSASSDFCCFAVRPGQVIEIRLRLSSDEAVRAPFQATVAVTWVDKNGKTVLPALAVDRDRLPHSNPLRVEVFGQSGDDDLTRAIAEAPRYVIPPPDAVELRLEPESPTVRIDSCRVNPLAVIWPRNYRAVRAAVEDMSVRRRSAAIARGVPAGSKTCEDISRIPLEQIDMIAKRFQPRGAWEPVIDSLSDDRHMQDWVQRRNRLLDRCEVSLRIGFIGTPQGHAGLCSLGDVFWIREAEYETQFEALDIDLLMIETAPESGPGDWQQAFFGLDGRMNETARGLIETAARAGIPFRLWATTPGLNAQKWAECAGAADSVCVTGDPEPWRAQGLRVEPVRRATDITACTAASLTERVPDLMLMPCGSDLFQDVRFAEFLSLPTACSLLITEFRYNFNSRRLRERINHVPAETYSAPSAVQQRYLMQQASIVLLPAKSLQGPAGIEQIALDSIASGAIPVLFGVPEKTDGILGELDRVFDIHDLLRLQELWRSQWVHERRWRSLFRRVNRDHVWTRQDRTALLGRDVFGDDFDAPLVSAILVSKRPDFVADAIARFREQSWDNKELIVLLNMDTMPDGLPNLRENEQVHLVPESANIGECLNLGISAAKGAIWTKIDDDDFYSRTYLEELQAYWKSSQAEVLGATSLYFYFADRDISWARSIEGSGCHLNPAPHISGATLSAERSDDPIYFSQSDRNSADSNWVQAHKQRGTRVFGFPSTTFTVFRSDGASHHTWRFTEGQSNRVNTSFCEYGNVIERFDNE